MIHLRINLRDAYAFINQHHRHHRRPQAAYWALGAWEDKSLQRLLGVAVVGRPQARHLAKDPRTAEVLRLCTDGTPNACSFLLSAARRVCHSFGLTSVITYTLASEPGASLRAAGWKVTHRTRGESWSRPSRPRSDKHPTEPKLRWEAPDA